MSNKVEKSPYKSYSVEDIEATERGAYVIQIGEELFSHNGRFGFTKQRAEAFYDDILSGLIHMRKHGTEEEQADALKCQLFLRMFPLRFH